MTDKLTPEARSENMRRIRAKNTLPEMIVRRLVHRLGYRYRLHRKDLPGKPDLVFPSRKKVIFVHGCFWHQHQDENCTIARKPKSNNSYWDEKLRRNFERDKQHQTMLAEMGWEYLILWECEVKDTDDLITKIEAYLTVKG